MSYVFKFKRHFWWTSFTVIGHNFDAAQDKLILFFPDGGVREIKHWRDCEVKLGTDWKLAQQKLMEEKAGTAIPLKV